MTTFARFVNAHPRAVLAVVIGAVLLLGLLGTGTTDRVSVGGYSDPHSESTMVDQLVRQHFGPQNPDVVALYTVPDGQTLDDIGPRVRQALGRIDATVLARPIETYWNSAPPRKGLLHSADNRQALAVVFTAGDDNARMRAYPDIEAGLRVPGIYTQLSGYSALAAAINHQSEHDLIVAESISLPITLLILVLLFGGAVAAAMPVAVGLLAVLGAMGTIRVLTEFTEVSTFALNIASLLGLGMAIDYGLFLVTRFREEVAEGHDIATAIERTYATAGRTVAFSALLLICAFAGTFVYPQAVLRSLGFGAISAVALAAALSLTVLPAMLALFGARIGPAGRQERTERFWGRVVDAVLRRPGIVTVVVGALLLALATPLFGLKLGDVDHRALPAGNEMRTTVEELTAQFPAASSGITAVLRGIDGTVPDVAAVESATREIGAVAGVRQVLQVGRDQDFVVLHAFLTAPDRSTTATAAVQAIRGLDPPAAMTLQVGGDTAATLDSVDSIVSRMPWMVLVMVTATVALLLAAFRSIVLPLKAVAMAFLSLAATFGILTWIFYEGHLAGPLRISSGPLAAGMVVLIVSVVFGLSTDYEVFLLSRMVEAHTAGADTAWSVRIGTVRTARVITAAATLLVLVTGAFTLSPLTPMRFLGIGMIIALIVDATLVRMLLVPALVKLMGRANWWLPGAGRRQRAIVTVVEKQRAPSAS